MRKKYTVYRQLLQSPHSSSLPCPLTLSLTARRINADWDVTVESWEQNILRGRDREDPADCSRSDVTSIGKDPNLVYRFETRFESRDHTPKSSCAYSGDHLIRHSHGDRDVSSRSTVGYQAVERYTFLGYGSNHICDRHPVALLHLRICFPLDRK